MPVSGGSASKSLSRASNPPAEAPRPTTRKSSGRDGASRCREAPRPGRSRVFSPKWVGFNRHGFGLSTLLCIAVRRSELGQQLELLPLRSQQFFEVLAEDPVQLLMQLDDLDLGLQIDLIIQAGG